MLHPRVPDTQADGDQDKTLMTRLLGSILARIRKVLADEASVHVGTVTLTTRGLDMLRLRERTVLAGLGPPVNMVVAFNFDDALLECLTQGMTDSLDMSERTEEPYHEECAAEAVNMALGFGTVDLQADDVVISLSPPIVLRTPQRVHRRKNAVFVTIHLTTTKGDLEIHVIGPKNLFDDQMNLSP